MVICANIRMVRPDGMDGIGWFSFEVVKRWVKNHPEHQFVFLCDRSSVKKMLFGPNVKVKVLFPPARRIKLINWWHNSARRYVNRFNPDIFVSMDGQFQWPIKVPVLTVIHDLNFHHHPEWMPEIVARFYNDSVPHCAAKSTRIATVSEYSRQDITRTYSVSEDKVDVVFNGYNEELLTIENKPKSDEPYFLFVGTQLPRKNIAGMIRSFSIFKAAYNTNHKLIMAGHNYYWDQEMQDALEGSGVKGDIEFVGRKSFEELKVLYSEATAMLYIPHFEGFGIPVIEAFAAGVPVICSNTTSIPEVAADAALQFDPEDHSSIAGGMHKLVTDLEFREACISRGKKRLEYFGWDNTAKALWSALKKTIA